MAFLPLGNSDLVVSVSINFPTNSKQEVPFHRIAYDCSRASEFCEWVQVEIDVYIPDHKYQVKPHSSP